MTSKYDPLGDYLRARPTNEIALSFADIEKITGAPLPPKAVNHPAWWSNNPSNNTMTQVWLDAGFRTERVEIGARKLVFRRSGPSRPSRNGGSLQGEAASAASVASPTPAPPGGILARVCAALSGTVRVVRGVSLTEPTGEVWEADS